MPEESERHGPPTYFANLVTMNINTDEMVMEFRRLMVAHKDFLKPGEGVIPIPPAPLEQIAKLEPIARVVVTFAAAKAIKQYLDQVLPEMEKQRRS